MMHAHQCQEKAQHPLPVLIHLKSEVNQCAESPPSDSESRLHCTYPGMLMYVTCFQKHTPEHPISSWPEEQGCPLMSWHRLLEYASLVWGGLSKGLSVQLERVQKRCGRIIGIPSSTLPTLSERRVMRRLSTPSRTSWGTAPLLCTLLWQLLPALGISSYVKEKLQPKE